MSPNGCWPRRRWATAVLACSVVAGLLAGLGCTIEAFLNATRPLGENIFLNASGVRNGGGQNRDDLGVGFINRTPYRAIGTFGGYDPQDQDTIVTFGQLGVTSDFDLEPNAVSPVYGLPATRAFTVGSRRLLQLIADNGLDSTTTFLGSYATGASFVGFLPSTDLLKEGLGFSGVPFGGDQGSVPTEGTAPPITLYIGQDYLFDSIVILELSEDQAVQGGFRIDFTTAKALGIDTERLIQLTPSDRALALEPFTEDPNVLDRRRYHVLAALGAPTVEGPTFTLSAGTVPDRATISVTNQTGIAITFAFFGPEITVIPFANGDQKEIHVLPGTYEYLIFPVSLAGPVSFNTRMLGAGVLASMTLLGAG